MSCYWWPRPWWRVLGHCLVSEPSLLNAIWHLVYLKSEQKYSPGCCRQRAGPRQGRSRRGTCYSNPGAPKCTNKTEVQNVMRVHHAVQGEYGVNLRGSKPSLGWARLFSNSKPTWPASHTSSQISSTHQSNVAIVLEFISKNKCLWVEMATLMGHLGTTVLVIL